MDWESHLEKNPILKLEKKNSKNPSEIAASEQKTTSEKANFCSNTVLSLLILERKISRRKTTRFFARLPVSA